MGHGFAMNLAFAGTPAGDSKWREDEDQRSSRPLPIDNPREIESGHRAGHFDVAHDRRGAINGTWAGKRR